MKNKLIPLIIILSLCLTGMNINAGIVIDDTSDISYPETVKVGDTLDITITFDYESTSDCLYGARIFLHYKLNYPSLSMADVTYVTIQEPDPATIALERPASMTISIDSSAILEGVEDETVIFTFQIQYDKGFLYYVGNIAQISKEDTAFTAWHELTIDNTGMSNTTLLCIIAGSVFAGICIIVVIYILIKKRK